MNKLKSLNKKQTTIIAITAVIAAALIVVGIIALTGEKDKIDVKEVGAEIESQLAEADLTEEEKAEVEELEAAMDSELAGAKSEKEKQEILNKYNDKISGATGGKVTVPTKPADTGSTKPSGGGSSSGSGDKPQTGGDKPSTGGNTGTDKPSTGGDNTGGSGSSGSGSGSSGGNTETKPPKEPEKPVEPEKPTEPEKPQPHTHTVTVGNTGKWFDSLEEAEACYDAEVAKWEAKFLSGQITYEELGRDCPSHWEWKQCMCGKVTLSWWSEATEPK